MSLAQSLADSFGDDAVFMDVKSARPGDWRKRIDESLAECGVVLVVIGRRWLAEFKKRQAEKDEVLYEITQALQLGKLIIPVTVDRARLPERDSLPADIAAVTDAQAYELGVGVMWRPTVEKLTDDIRSFLAEQPSVTESAHPQNTAAIRPQFNEYDKLSPNFASRNGATIDLWLIHTQEGGSPEDTFAVGLAEFLQSAGAASSYHYLISEDAHYHDVTVCHLVDTDNASWSVLNANARSINACFAGSRSQWTRDEWMTNAARAIDVAAYVAVQDCRKYNIPTTVITPPYSLGLSAGISDHCYVTQALHEGSHTDVGSGFPWDYFAQRVAVYAEDIPEILAADSGAAAEPAPLVAADELPE